MINSSVGFVALQNKAGRRPVGGGRRRQRTGHGVQRPFEDSFVAEFPGLEHERERRRGRRHGAIEPRPLIGADRELSEAERRADRARGFAAGNDQATDAEIEDHRRRDRGQKLFRFRRGRVAAEALLQRVHLGLRNGGADGEEQAFRHAAPGEADGFADDVLAAKGAREVQREDGTALREPRQLRERLRRHASGQHRAGAIHSGQRDQAFVRDKPAPPP